MAIKVGDTVKIVRLTDAKKGCDCKYCTTRLGTIAKVVRMEPYYGYRGGQVGIAGVVVRIGCGERSFPMEDVVLARGTGRKLWR
jgi:hypothetical protein